MKRLNLLAVLLMIAVLGCPAPDGNTPVTGGANPSGDSTAETTDGSEPETTDSSASEATDGENPTDGSGTETKLSSDNTLIQFVGVHADPEKPDPRTGNFGQFGGTASVTDGKLTAVNVEIDTASLSTDIEKLTNHLKSADFFNVNKYPHASFQSTAIEDAGEGAVNITGDLTLLDVTKAITFPATVSTDDGLSLEATFTIDRTEFGMDFGVENVKKEVEMTVKIPK